MTIGLTTNYFSFGSGAPSGAPSVASGEYAFYENTANGDLYEWNLSGTPGWTKIFDHAGVSASISTTETVMGSNHTIAASSTWETLVSASLAAGTYQVHAETQASDGTTTRVLMASLYDGTTRYAPKWDINRATGVPVLFVCSAQIVLASSGTISFQGYESGATGSIFYAADGILTLPGVTRMLTTLVA